MHPSLSFTISHLDSSPHKAPDWIPMWKRQLKYGLCILPMDSWLNLLRSQNVSHPKGSIRILWLVILTPGTRWSWTVPLQREWVTSQHSNTLLSHRSQGKVKTFKSWARSSQVALLNTSVPFTNTHFAWRQFAGGAKHQGRHFDRLPVDCWCSRRFGRMRLYRPASEGGMVLFRRSATIKTGPDGNRWIREGPLMRSD